MRNLGDAAFFRMFDVLLTVTNPGLRRSRWSHDGAQIERERHSFTGPAHGLAIEIFTLTRLGRCGWSLMVVKEYWWTGEEGRAVKNLRWARLTGGHRRDLLSWLRAQENEIGHDLFVQNAHGLRADNELVGTDGDDADE